MADTVRDESAILALFADNITEDISAQDLRDFVVSVRNLVRTGWANYQDSTYTAGSPLALSSNTRTLVTNDAANPATTEVHLPYDTKNTGNGSWWDAVTNKFLPTNNGDAYDLRFNMKAQTTATQGAYLLLELDIGGTIGDVYGHTFSFARGANTTHYFDVSIPIFTGSTFIANGGAFYVTANNPSTIWDIQLVVVRTYANGAL